MPDNQPSRSPRRKVVGGDRAGDILKSVDRQNYLLAGAELAVAAANKQAVPGTPAWQDEPDIVMVKNTTGDDWERGWCCAFSAPLIAQSKRLETWWQERSFLGIRPEACHLNRLGRIFVTAEPIRAGAIGRCYASGVCKAKVIFTDTGHEYADVDPVAGGYKLISRSGGSSTAQILEIGSDQTYSPPTTGELWATVRLQNGTGVHFVAKALDALAGIGCSTPCPAQARFKVYAKDPCGNCLVEVLDDWGKPVEIRAGNIHCQPIPVGSWCIPHCDRFGDWWVDPEQPVEAMLRAYECIYPGSTSGTAKRQRQGSAGYEDDPAHPYPEEVDNTDCLVFALPGELIRARRESCCSGKWIPTAEHGLTRRVKIDTCIPCGESGTAKVLQSICGGGSEGDGCDDQESTCSTIKVCNHSGRPISPCGAEEAVAQMTPGVKSTATDCCWYLQPGPFPTRAQASLGDKLCPGDSPVISGAAFPTFCATEGTWTPPTTATNPYGLAGCSGALVELAPRFTDCNCQWEIVQVKPQVVDELMFDTKLECLEEGCGLDLKAKKYKKVLLWSCDDTVCNDSAEWEAASTLAATTYRVMVDLTADCTGSGGCGGLTKGYRDICVLCPGEAATSTGSIPFTAKTFLTAVSGSSGGCGEGDCKITYQSVTVCGLWCTSSTTAGTAFTMTAVDVLTPPAGDYCTCEGLNVGKRTILVPCVCAAAETDEQILKFKMQTVYDSFKMGVATPTTEPPPNCTCICVWNGEAWSVKTACGGTCAGGQCHLPESPGIEPGEERPSFCHRIDIFGDPVPTDGAECKLWGHKQEILTIDCCADDLSSGDEIILDSKNVSVVTEVMCGTCIERTVTEVCVLAIGDTDSGAADGCSCSDECPPEGSGS